MEEGMKAPGTFSRRTFCKGSALAAVAAATCGATALYESTEAVAEEPPTEDEVIWNTCAGCGVGKCPLQFHVKDGVITYVEGDTTGSNEFGGLENRACLRGRTIRHWINHPDRLKRPLKRVGKRGEGKFEEISWDEAADIFADKLKHVIDTYGNEAVLKNGALGIDHGGGAFIRFMNLNGGMLGSYGTDSEGQADAAAGYMLHGDFYWGASYEGSPTPVMKDSDLVVLFGSSAATSRINGGSCMYDIAQARENGARIVWVDVRMGEEMSAHPEEWLPIRPGTDGALAAALCHVMIDEGLADEEFLHTHTVGYDEETMPESARGQHKSYKDYIMGTGYDMVAKTPEWAEPITQIPAQTIYQLARDIANAKAAFIGCGVGVQRRSNGENACTSIMMIPLVSGQWGLPGTSTGLKAKTTAGPYVGSRPGKGKNPVKASIPVVKRIEAVERGHEFTALRDGLRGADKLNQDVKFCYAHSSGMIANQCPDVNWSTSVMADESKCEFIVGSDFFMTSTMKYCDLVLPETMCQEETNVTYGMSSGSIESLVFGRKVQEPYFDCRSEWDWMADVAERFGMRDEFLGDKTPDEMREENYAKLVAGGKYPTLPKTLEEGFKQGYWWQEAEAKPQHWDFREDPVANPLPTPSGKVEVYSETVAKIADTWELDDPRDVISPIPVYNPGVESYEDATDKYPLMGSSWKSKIRYHSKFNQNPLLNQAHRHVVWINPKDAEPRGIKNGDMVRVHNDRGEIRIEARVTPRIVPGAFALEEGKMRDIDEKGVDQGGCVNTLTTHHWSPLAKHNNSNSILAQIEKA